MRGPAFRKTAAGQSELQARTRGLDARTRSVLILANGALEAAALSARLGFDAGPALQRLADAGLLEPVPDAPRVRSAPAPAPPPPPAPALPPPDLALAGTRAVRLLGTHFGPDAVRMTAPLREARSGEAFAQALAALRETLAVHMGRRLAEQLARQIAEGP